MSCSVFLDRLLYILQWGAWIAQLVERPTEKPGAILTHVLVPGAAKDFSPRIDFQCRLSLRCPHSPRVQSHSATSVRTLKIPKHWQPHHCWDARKYCTHTDRNMVSAALAAAVPYPDKATRISRKGQ